MTTKEELTFQVFQILTEYDLETFGQQQYTCEKIAEFIMQREASHHNAIKEKDEWLQLNAELNAKFVVQLAEKNTEIKNLQAQIARMREALEKVEWIWDGNALGYICPWCSHFREDKHAPDCQRQAALAKMEVKPTPPPPQAQVG